MSDSDHFHEGMPATPAHDPSRDGLVTRSDEHLHSTALEAVAQEEDVIAARPVVLLILAGVLLVVIGVVWPWEMLRRTPAAGTALVPASAPHVAEPLPRIIGGLPQNLATDQWRDVERSPARDAGGAETAQAAQPIGGELDRFTWADRERGTVKVPAEIAAELWLERETRRRSSSNPTPAEKATP